MFITIANNVYTVQNEVCLTLSILSILDRLSRFLLSIL